jgi:hypothetical protein
MGCVGMLTRLRAVAGRWDTPATPRWRRHEFGFVLLTWLIVAAAGVYSLATWSLVPLFFFGLVGPCIGAAVRHRWDVQRDAPGMSPLPPATDADNHL